MPQNEAGRLWITSLRLNIVPVWNNICLLNLLTWGQRDFNPVMPVMKM